MHQVLSNMKGLSKQHTVSDTQVLSKYCETLHRSPSANGNYYGSYQCNWWYQAIRFSKNLIRGELWICSMHLGLSLLSLRTAFLWIRSREEGAGAGDPVLFCFTSEVKWNKE